MESIIGIHLINGMTIVGEVVGAAVKGNGVRCDGLLLRFPMQIQANETTYRKDGKMDMMMSPAVILTKTVDILYNNDHILWEFQPTENVTEAYKKTIEKAKSNLILPDEKKLLLS